MHDESLDEVRGWIEAAQAITVVTGAGISTDSGIPDFRGPKGLWTKNPDAEKMATLDSYMADPEIRKRSWQMRADMVDESIAPNPGHDAVTALDRQGKLHTLITQNVDGLHQRAGTSAERIVEIHGTIHEVTCMSCEDRAPMERVLERVRAGEDDPPCRLCGGILKSATISFGQNLVPDDLVRADQAARECDLMLAVGSTLAVYPAAGVVPVARKEGARIVIVNGDPTEMDDLAHAVLRGSISDILPRIVGTAGA